MGMRKRNSERYWVVERTSKLDRDTCDNFESGYRDETPTILGPGGDLQYGDEEQSTNRPVNLLLHRMPVLSTDLSNADLPMHWRRDALLSWHRALILHRIVDVYVYKRAMTVLHLQLVSSPNAHCNRNSVLAQTSIFPIFINCTHSKSLQA